MIKVPWTGPLESRLEPYQGAVMLGILAFVIVSIYIVWKGNATGRTAWLAFLIM